MKFTARYAIIFRKKGGKIMRRRRITAIIIVLALVFCAAFAALPSYAANGILLGINDSMIHVDFMIGYEGLDIDALTLDGKVVPIIRRGRWAF